MSECANQKLRLLDLLLNEQGIQAQVQLMITRRGNLNEFPLSFAQKRLWFLNHLEPGPHYNDHFNLRLQGPLQVPVLQRCLNEIVRRHEALRSRFSVARGEPVQELNPPADVPLPVVDLSALPEPERKSRAAAIAIEEGRAPFTLQTGPLLRVRLLRLAPDDHQLLLTLHHIVIDGWSRGVFLREFTALYQAFLAGNPSPLSPLSIQYADFAFWQEEWMRNGVLAKQLAYWKQQLAGAPALLEWPTDFPRPEILSYRGARLPIRIPRRLADALIALSRRERCTLFMTLFAAFQTLAARYTRQEDIVIGTPIANRNRAEIENLIGAFVNTLVLRTNFSGNPSFREILARVRETALAGYAHQDMPFEKLVEELHPARNQSYNPVFQVMFIFQNAPMPVLKTAGISIRPFEIDSGVAKFDLTLNLEETPNGLEGWIEYATDLFRPETIVRLVGHYQTLLEGVVANPDQSVATLPLLTASERERVLVGWNDTERDYPRERCLHELLAEQAARTPEAVAVEFRGERLSYQELHQKAGRVAARLRALGVGPDTLVGLCVERSPEMVVGLLGILKAGGAYVPLDPNYPPERLAFILADARVSVLLTQESLLGHLPKPSGPVAPRVLCLDPQLSAFAAVGEAAPPPAQKTTTPEHLAYVLYTSGSTGKPKGVQIPHRALVNFLYSMAREPGLSAADSLLAVTTLSFDIAGLELWLPLLVGARVVVADSATVREGPRLAALLEQSRATVMQATPATWRLLLESGWPGDPRLKLLCGGEAWGLELAQALLPRCASLWNLYGPTETTIWSAAVRVGPGESPSLGGPIANTQLYVLDHHLQPVPVGVPGELHIGGEGLARGYLNRPELTQEKFVPDPFKQGGRLYKTGDLVRWRGEAGRLEFLGRLDHQVKIRGFRIELGEIESVLRLHPNVREAVVVAGDGPGGEKRLAAYVVARQTPAPTVAELRAQVGAKLPEYMVPATFMLLEALPLTPNGKIDRKALPSPEAERVEKVFVAPRDPLELQLAQIWEKIFAREPIGIRDNFFELGGHSLLAVRLFAQVDKLTGKSLPLVTLFQAPTIEQLAAILRQQGWESPWSSLVPIKADGSKPPFYCVHGVGGNILEYLDLAKYMDADQPFYGLQAAGLNGKHPWHKSVEEMAAHYNSEIRAFQPRGPYYIGGSSFGGMVAFEMARQLHAAGEQVALLAFFDTYAPGFPRYLPNTSVWQMKWNETRLRAELHWGNFMAARGRAKWDYAWTKTKKYGFSVVWRFRRLKRRTRERLEKTFHPKAIKEAHKSGQKAACVYMPGTYPGRAVLFRATGRMKGIEPDPLQGWGPFVEGGLEIYDTPGHHGAIVRDPRARVLAEQLNDSLRKAQAAASAEKKKVPRSGLRVPGAGSAVEVAA